MLTRASACGERVKLRPLRSLAPLALQRLIASQHALQDLFAIQRAEAFLSVHFSDMHMSACLSDRRNGAALTVLTQSVLVSPRRHGRKTLGGPACRGLRTSSPMRWSIPRTAASASKVFIESVVLCMKHGACGSPECSGANFTKRTHAPKEHAR